MTQATAAAADGRMTPEELAAWVADLRATQGLPPTVQNATSLSRIATIMRSAQPQRVRRRAG